MRGLARIRAAVLCDEGTKTVKIQIVIAEKPCIFKGFSFFEIKYTKKVKNIFKTY